ncbi:hypothetical protein JOQ06_018493, partial [Pogonophryne albipinna]
TTVSLYPFQIHSIVLSSFASIMGPFGGFFASGFKRAFKTKDFANMSFIRGPNPSKVIQQLLALRIDQQLHIFNSLKAHLTEKGFLPALEDVMA